MKSTPQLTLHTNSGLELALSEAQQIIKKHPGLLSGMLSYQKDAETWRYIAREWFEQTWVSLEAIHTQRQQFLSAIEAIERLWERLESMPLSDAERWFLGHMLPSIKNRLSIGMNAIFLEAEKAWFPLSDEERTKYQDAVNHFQNLVYGNPISENPEEVAFVVGNLWQRFQNASWRLSDSDQKTFREFLERFQPEPKVVSVSRIATPLETPVAPEHIKPLFTFVLHEIYGLSDWEAVVDANATMFSANSATKVVTLPQSKIADLSLFRLLQLFDHEIGTHALRGQNMLRTLGVAGAHYLEHEEGWAMLSEKLFTESSETLTLEPTLHHITTFIAENYPATETENLIRIYFLLAGIKENPADRMLRVKRFVSFLLPGANRKDVSYTRGNLDIIREWRQLAADPEARKRFVRDFYFSKLSLSDQSYVPGMRESMNISDEDIIYPLWIGKILAKKLQGDSIFFNTRFPESDDRKNFLDEDGRFVVERISFDVQRKIVTLLKMIRSHTETPPSMTQKNTTK